MLKLCFHCIFTSKLLKAYSYAVTSVNISCRKMNVYKGPEHKASLDDLKSTNKGGDFTQVYVMSRIEGLSATIKNLCSENCHGLLLTEINVPVDTDSIDPSCTELRNAKIVICDPVILGCNYKNMPKLEWAHSTWAGVEPLFEIMKEKPHFILTRHSHEDFSELMAEYVMGHILIIEKNYRNIWAAQTEKCWSKMKNFSESSPNRLIKELILGILGVGNMGQAIARFFKPHGTKVIGLGKTPRKSSEFGFFDNIEVSLTEVLSSSDYIINTLPSTPETVGMLDGDALQACRKKPVFINVGRGNIIHENTLLKALENEWLSHVVLDVFQKEPLPPDSKLWNSSQVTITPHCAAISFPKTIAKDFLASFLNYQQKSPLKNIVDWGKGY